MASVRSQVITALDHVAESLSGLETPVMRAVLPVLERAHEEVQRELRKWIATHHGADTFTAQRHRNVLAGIRRGLRMMDDTGDVLEKSLKDEFKRHIGPLSVRNLMHEWEKFGSIFEGSIQPIAIQEGVLLATGKKLLWPQFKSSAQKYAAGVGERTQLHLAISRMRAETIHELTNRLERHLPDVFASNRWDAERLARTETLGAYNEVHREGIEQAHRDDSSIRSRCDATYDWRRCPMCGSMDGQVIDRSKGEKFHAVWRTVTKKGIGKLHARDFDSLPFHPCCRCSETIWRESWAKYSRRDNVADAPRWAA